MTATSLSLHPVVPILHDERRSDRLSSGGTRRAFYLETPMLKLCKHLERSVDRTEHGARHACPECRLLAEVLKDGEVEVRPMVSLTRKVGCR